MTDAQLDQLSINTIRTLSIDAVQQAKSGHPGTPMALAPLVYTLWNRVMRFDPADHEQAAGKVGDAGAQRTEVLADRILLYVRNGDEALAAVRGLGLEPQTSLVRRSTLEDVFLRLTGRRLED